VDCAIHKAILNFTGRRSAIKLSRYILAVVLLLCKTLALYAQNTADADTTSIETYNKLISRYRYDKPDSAVFFAQKGLKAARNREDKTGEAVILNQLGMIADNVGGFDESRKHYRHALDIYKQLGNTKGMALEIIRLGVVEMRNGNYDVAIDFFLQALQISQKDGNKMGVMEANITLGEAYAGQKLFHTALDYYHKAEELNNQLPFSNLSLNLANDFGIALRETGRTTEAKKYLNSGIAKSNVPKYQGLNITLINTLASVFAKEGNTKKSIELQKAALAKAREINNYIRQIQTLTGLATTYANIGNQQQALIYYKEAYRLAEERKSPKEMIDMLGRIAAMHTQNKDYKAALDVRSEQYKVADEYFFKQMAKQIASLQAAYELNQSRSQVEQLSFANRQQRMERKGIISVMIGVVVMLLVVGYFYYRTSRLNRLLNETNNQLQQSNDVKDKLFSVLGHDLRSPFISLLNMLQIMEDDGVSAEDKSSMIAQLEVSGRTSLEILTNLLKWGEMQIKGVRINPSDFRLKTITDRNILMLADAAQNKGIDIQNHIVADVCVMADPDHFEFVIRNLISNAIKFSYLEGQVIITATQSGNMVEIAVQDNGTGMTQEQAENIFSITNVSISGTDNEKGTSLGLMLCREFIELNGGKIWVSTAPAKGSTFHFTLQSC
jgi:signal transduction histidine kinase